LIPIWLNICFDWIKVLNVEHVKWAKLVFICNPAHKWILLSFKILRKVVGIVINKLETRLIFKVMEQLGSNLNAASLKRDILNRVWLDSAILGNRDVPIDILFDLG
jgi:hypothetical protein